jgi:hypothetical protein
VPGIPASFVYPGANHSRYFSCSATFCSLSLVTKKSHNRISNRPLPMGERQSPHPLSMRPSTPQPNSPKLPPIHRPHRDQIRMRRRRMRCLHRSHIQTSRRKTRTSKCKRLSFSHPCSGRIAHYHRGRNRELEGRCQNLRSG